MKHFIRCLAVLPILAILFMLGSSPVSAAELRSGDSVVIASGDEVNDDLYIGASRITINGTVNGDVFCAGETITVNGKINGSILALGSTININGEITRSVHAAGANIIIGGKVAGDVTVAGGTLDLAGASATGRDLLFAASDANIGGPIGRGIKGYTDTLDIRNNVAGDVDVEVRQLTISSTAKIEGNLTYVSDNEAIIRTGAQIGGSTTRTLPEPRQSFPANLAVWGGIIAFLMTLVTGSLVILLAPGKAAAAVEAIKRQPLSALGWGALILFAAPVAILIVFITIIGIPVSMIGLVFYILAIYLSQIVAGLFLGYVILVRYGKDASRGVLVGSFALGLTILTLVKLIPVIGFFVWLAEALFGIGALALAIRNGRHAPAAPVVVS
jgi:cytoskeletal protein CcmA (bactofilin family)